MRFEPIPWNDEYNIGDAQVDAQHQNLFAVLSDLLELTEESDYDEKKQTCQETIEFLKKYTIQHFQDEEKYMRSIGYSGFEMHKQLHDTMREVTLPELEKDLVEHDYSEEALLHFIGMMAGWLTGHIIIEDRAITGRVFSKWHHAPDVQGEDLVDEEFRKFVQGTFHIELRLFHRHYAGEPLNKPMFYETMFTDSKGAPYQAFLITEESMIHHIVGNIIGAHIKTMDKESLMAYLMLSQSLTKAAVQLVNGPDEYTLMSHKLLQPEEFREKIKYGYPEYSLMWRCEAGCIGICVKM